MVQRIQEPDDLREAVSELYKRHVRQQVQADVMDGDISREYERQKDYLEKSVAALKQRLQVRRGERGAEGGEGGEGGEGKRERDQTRREERNRAPVEVCVVV